MCDLIGFHQKHVPTDISGFFFDTDVGQTQLCLSVHRFHFQRIHIMRTRFKSSPFTSEDFAGINETMTSSLPLFVESLLRHSKQDLLTFAFVFASLSRLIMPKFTVAPECFGDPDGISGSAMAEKAGIRFAKRLVCTCFALTPWVAFCS
jgi:hypothetical protein